MHSSTISRRSPHLALLAALALLPACDAGAAPVESVVLFTLDTTRADVLFGTDHAQQLAPRISALAGNGVRFARAYTVAPVTLPAHASMLTGLVPPRHGLRDNGHAALPPAAETLAEELAAHGMETAAFVSALVLDRGFGLDQGFERYDQPPLQARTSENESVERPGAITARAAADWLAARDSERPFFLWVHLYDAHIPYEPAPEHLARAGGDAYRGEVAALDDAVGVVLDALAEQGLEDETLVVLTADHGESLGEHGEPSHGALCYEATVHVPLVLHFPGPPPHPGPMLLASLVDLYPTVLGRLGLPIPPGLDGFDLFAADAPRERGVYFESYSGFLNYGWSPLAGWLDARGKYLVSSAPEFYQSFSDPREVHDLVESRAEECALARERIGTLLARPALPGQERLEDPDLDKALDALGYARGDRVGNEDLPSPLAPSERPSPKERARELAPLLRAHALFEAGRHAEAQPLLAEILRENQRHILALDLHALCLMYARDFARAAEDLRKRLALHEAADTRLNLGLCWLELGRPDEARSEIETAARLAPDHPAIQEALARLPPR